MVIQILVLNLKKDSARWQFMQSQLKGLGPERIDGVLGKTLPASIKAKYTPATTAKPTPWGDGQLGCFLSHKKAWQAVIGSDQPALILEDDLHLSPALAEFLKNTSWLPTDADVIRLETSTNAVKLGATAATHQGRTIRPLKSTAWCAGAYILTPKGAKKCLAAPLRESHAADAFLFNYEMSPLARRLNIYQLTPTLAVQDKYSEGPRQGFLSNLEKPGNGQQASFISRLIRLPRRAARALLGYHYLKYQE